MQGDAITTQLGLGRKPVCAAQPVPRRISVVGSTGSGKTYLARRLSQRLGLPLVELDRLRQACSQNPADAAQDFYSAVSLAVGQDSWIIDGHYREIRELVWREADLVIHLDYPLPVIARQLVQRYLAKRRATDPAARLHRTVPEADTDAALPSEHASWRKRLLRVRKTMAERREYDRVLAQIEHPEVRLKRFKSSAAAEAWLQTL